MLIIHAIKYSTRGFLFYPEPKYCMGRAKSKQKKRGTPGKRKTSKSSQVEKMSSSTWVDNLSFRPLNRHDGISSSDGQIAEESVSISIISWNILADGYNSPKSQRNLPRQYQNIVFDKMRRGSIIRKILVSGAQKQDSNGSTSDDSPQLYPDVWALQEVDMDEILAKHLGPIGYDGVETPRMKIGCGSGGRADSCGIYYRKDRWTLLDQEVIRLDDLATLPASLNGKETGEIDSVNNNLQGLQGNFLRRNNALLVRLQNKENTDSTIVIAVTHLYWNPIYEYVKLCQIHYIMIRAKRFLKSENEPFVLCGDLNSLPGNTVHKYLTKGVVNAKVVAPWYRECDDNIAIEADGESIDGVTQKISSLNLNNGKKRPEQPPTQQVRYILDYNLNKLCRWFRILGLDVGLETEEEERLRTKEGKNKLFERCRHEHRVLITSSNKLLARKDCPAGTYLISPKSLALNLEVVFVHILLSHGVVLEPHKFLSRCVVCNGDICTVYDPDLKIKIFTDHQAPVDLKEELEVYQCNGCKQGYWWCDRPTSSATRVKSQASRLYQLCLQAGVPIRPPMEEHMFEHIDVENERRKGWDWSAKGSELLKLRLQVTEWLKDSQLTCPVENLLSAYKDETLETGESLPYTNVTSDFEGTLDYIFFGEKHFAQTDRLYVPTSYDELTGDNHIRNGHLLPSDCWPSDHLAIGAKLTLRSSTKAKAKEASNDDNNKTSEKKITHQMPIHQQAPPPPPGAMFCAPTATGAMPSAIPPQLMQLATGSAPAQGQAGDHPQRCDCGCVPNILSLFEMAELRKKARQKRQADKRSN